MSSLGAVSTLGTAGETSTTGATLGSATFFAAAFLATAFCTGASGSTTFVAAAFLTAGGSSGCLSRMSPSFSARRRTRSAWASSIEED